MLERLYSRAHGTQLRLEMMTSKYQTRALRPSDGVYMRLLLIRQMSHARILIAPLRRPTFNGQSLFSLSHNN